MPFVTLTTHSDEPSRPSLRDLKMTTPELFGCVIEGTCPGCHGPLVPADLRPVDQRYAQRCGWCEPCLWGWSATVARGDEAWGDGEKLVTVYASGALA